MCSISKKGPTLLQQCFSAESSACAHSETGLIFISEPSEKAVGSSTQIQVPNLYTLNTLINFELKWLPIFKIGWKVTKIKDVARVIYGIVLI